MPACCATLPLLLAVPALAPSPLLPCRCAQLFLPPFACTHLPPTVWMCYLFPHTVPPSLLLLAAPASVLSTLTHCWLPMSACCMPYFDCALLLLPCDASSLPLLRPSSSPQGVLSMLCSQQEDCNEQMRYTALCQCHQSLLVSVSIGHWMNCWHWQGGE